MPDIDATLLTTREAADIAQEGVRQIIRRVENGTLTPVRKLPGLRGAYLFNESDILALAPHAAAETSPEAVSAAALSRSGDAA